MVDWASIHEDRKLRTSYLPLVLLSYIYGFAVKLNLCLFGDKNAHALPGFTLSIGNLTAGGTGKTPVTMMMAGWAVTQGYKVAILSRGYGGGNKKKVFIVSDGRNIFADPKATGDEPFMLADRLKGVPVIVSKSRYLAGLEAHKKFGSTFFILDDGFQHLGLKRDLNILLLDASSPFGNGHLLPLGPLREPESELKRADAVILTRADSGYDNGLKKLVNSKPLFMGDHVPEKVVFPTGSEAYPPDFLNGKRVVAFAGIARPHFFKDTLVKLGAEILYFKAFPDHYTFEREDIKSLISIRNDARADFLITTEKDWVKIAELINDERAAAYLTIKFDLLYEKEQFFKMVKEYISYKPGS